MGSIGSQIRGTLPSGSEHIMLPSAFESWLRRAALVAMVEAADLRTQVPWPKTVRRRFWVLWNASQSWYLTNSIADVMRSGRICVDA